MSVASAVAAAVTFVWLGLVTAISFVETPLKFRAPDVTLPIGLGIGRLVFGALNRLEMLFGVVIAVALVAGARPAAAVVAYAVVVAALVVQLAVLRPRMNRRTDAVLAGAERPRSRRHHYYVGLELLKVIALITAGALLLFS
jgi:hypothetical protein